MTFSVADPVDSSCRYTSIAASEAEEHAGVWGRRACSDACVSEVDEQADFCEVDERAHV